MSRGQVAEPWDPAPHRRTWRGTALHPLTDDDGGAAGGIADSRENGRAWTRSSRVDPLPGAVRVDAWERVEYPGVGRGPSPPPVEPTGRNRRDA